METEKYNDFLGERIFINELPNGIKSYIIPKNDYVTRQAVVAVNYGSADIRFSAGEVETQYPAGVAHFLEHKMFEKQNGSVFEAFTKIGAEINAFTNYTNTAYYFNTIRNFDESLRLLFSAVLEPYFTDETVEKEKGIIIQEIDMYNDDPFWRAYLGMLEAMYHECPIKQDIAGTAESVSKITKDMLYDCYNAFYRPANMAVICVGDFDRQHIYNSIKESFAGMAEQNAAARIYGNEPGPVLKAESIVDMHTPAPVFCIGFKDNLLKGDITNRMASSKILLDCLAGEGSELYGKLHADNLIDDSFSCDYSSGAFFGFSMFTGTSENPRKVYEMILAEASRLQKNGLDRETFERVRKKHLGRLVKTFNVINGIAVSSVDLFSKSADLLSLADSFNRVTIADAALRLNGLTHEFGTLSAAGSGLK